MKIAFFGSSLVSAYWNGAATYYRGIIKWLNRLGHEITFYEPDAFDRQQHRDLDDPNWAAVVVYEATEHGVINAVKQAANADVIVKASGVGIFDSLLEHEVINYKTARNLVIYWDVDAPATLERIENNPDDSLKPLIPNYDLILTYGGGAPVVDEFLALGARQCVPVYNALDPESHFRAPSKPEYSADLMFMGNRLPDREARVEQFFLSAAEMLPNKRFILGGNGWFDKSMPSNVNYIGHVYTRDHNCLNSSCLAALNINREGMARFGFSPPTRVFEAAGAGACLITDEWPGIEEFLEPGEEALIAKDGLEVANYVGSLSPERAAQIGQSAMKRICAKHTYRHRAEQVHELLTR